MTTTRVAIATSRLATSAFFPSPVMLSMQPRGAVADVFVNVVSMTEVGEIKVHGKPEDLSASIPASKVSSSASPLWFTAPWMAAMWGWPEFLAASTTFLYRGPICRITSYNVCYTKLLRSSNQCKELQTSSSQRRSVTR